jgi:predicted 2-oxoglutarate/Fe(II)-dependent dioxygenase YbiX
MINKIKLSENYNIYKTFDPEFSFIKEECLKYAYLNDSMVQHRKIENKPNSVWVEINPKCFLNINNKIKKHIEEISKRKFKNYAEHYWVYTQTKHHKLEWMHQHLLVHPHGRSNIKTDYTFTYYLQTPKDITGDEGHLIFETEDKMRHKFLPNEGDIFIFPADIRHTAVPTPNSKIDRIVYAGNLCLDVENQVIYNNIISGNLQLI